MVDNIGEGAKGKIYKIYNKIMNRKYEDSMDYKVDVNCVYVPSEDVVARVIEDEIIIVPLVAGIGDMEDELYTLNETGRAIWEKLDGKKNLKEIIDDLASEFDSSKDELEEDILGFVQELFKRKMLVET